MNQCPENSSILDCSASLDMTGVRYWAILPAGGVGLRMQSQVPKQYLSLLGKSVLEHSIETLLSYPLIQKIVVVVSETDTFWPTLRDKFSQDRVLSATGGEWRHQSVYRGLQVLASIAASDDWVLVHDAVRPCLKQADVDRLIQTVGDHPCGGLLGIKVQDTLKTVDSQGRVQGTIDRSGVWYAQTPQMFRMNKLSYALERVIQEQHTITDEAGALQIIGEYPLMVEGNVQNIKITYPEDLLLAGKLLEGSP